MFEKYLITGATGFLGRAVLAQLRDTKAEIRALVSLPIYVRFSRSCRKLRFADMEPDVFHSIFPADVVKSVREPE